MSFCRNYLIGETVKTAVYCRLKPAYNQHGTLFIHLVYRHVNTNEVVLVSFLNNLVPIPWDSLAFGICKLLKLKIIFAFR